MSHDYRDVLLKAASRVEQEGMWCQGEFVPGVKSAEIYELMKLAPSWSEKPACALGSLAIAAVDLAHDPIGAYEDAVERMQEALAGEWPAQFNDEPGRTAFEVAEAMRKAAE